MDFVSAFGIIAIAGFAGHAVSRRLYGWATFFCLTTITYTMTVCSGV